MLKCVRCMLKTNLGNPRFAANHDAHLRKLRLPIIDRLFEMCDIHIVVLVDEFCVDQCHYLNEVHAPGCRDERYHEIF